MRVCLRAKKHTLNCALQVTVAVKVITAQTMTKPTSVATRLVCRLWRHAHLTHLHRLSLERAGPIPPESPFSHTSAALRSDIGHAHVGVSVYDVQVSCHGHKPRITQWKLQQKQVLTIKTPVLIVSDIKCYITLLTLIKFIYLRHFRPEIYPSMQYSAHFM